VTNKTDPLPSKEQLRSALQSLVNEVRGVMSLAESEIREAAGNTNFSVLLLRTTEAMKLLEGDAPETPEGLGILYTTRCYPCGCKAAGSGDVPAYCSTHECKAAAEVTGPTDYHSVGPSKVGNTAVAELASLRTPHGEPALTQTGSLWMVTKLGDNANCLGRVYRDKQIALTHKDFDEVVVELRLAPEPSECSCPLGQRLSTCDIHGSHIDDNS
jgi:hypothetical protein